MVVFAAWAWDGVLARQWELRHFVTPSIQTIVAVGWGVAVVVGLVGVDRTFGLLEAGAARCLTWGEGYLGRHPTAALDRVVLI